MKILLEEYKRFLLLLIKHQVEFILIGGYAVIYYGYARTTGDMDIWLKPDNVNRDKFIKVLTEFGIITEDVEVLKNFDFNSTLAFHIGNEPNKIDFLTKIEGVSFEEANKAKLLFPLEDKQVPIIRYHHLILSKISSNRSKDKADIDELQKINQYRKNKY
jgi:hypothetical protein